MRIPAIALSGPHLTTFLLQLTVVLGLALLLGRLAVGLLILTTAVIVDAAGWLLLSVISAVAVGGLRAATLGRSFIGLVFAVVAAATIGRVLVRAVLRLVARASRPGDPGPTAAVVVVLVIAAAAGTQALGYEPVLGAFACGIVIGRCADQAPPALGRHTQIYGEAAGAPARLLPDGAI